MFVRHFFFRLYAAHTAGNVMSFGRTFPANSCVSGGRGRPDGVGKQIRRSLGVPIYYTCTDDRIGCIKYIVYCILFIRRPTDDTVSSDGNVLTTVEFVEIIIITFSSAV